MVSLVFLYIVTVAYFEPYIYESENEKVQSIYKLSSFLHQFSDYSSHPEKSRGTIQTL